MNQTKADETEIKAQFPKKVSKVIQAKARYKVLYGGRGGAKSVSFAKDLVLKTAFNQLRVLCTREIQNTIRDSVYKLLLDQIEVLGLEDNFIIRRDGIYSVYGSEFIFKGLRRNIREIKSTEGIDIAWVEEAEAVSKESWEILIPTIRKESSEIWISFNPEEEKSPVWQRFVENPPKGAVVQETNYNDNPFLPEVLRKEMEHCKKVDYDAYLHIWEGKFKKYSDALIFHNKFVVQDFDEPKDVERFFYGVDWGYAHDPLLMGRMFIKENKLYIDQEAGGVGVENEEIEELFDTVPGSRKWKIVADSARPEMISYIRRKGFDIVAAKKGPGSVEDGIQFLRSFEQIVIHPRCKRIKENFENYKWKVDKTGEILPVPVKAFDHGIDLSRYALEDYIRAYDSACFETQEYDVMPTM